MYAVEISVEKDRKTGGTKILSTSAVSPEDVHQRGVKVYDDGHKMVYEVRSSGPGTMENGVHPWSPADVDDLMQHVNHPLGDSTRTLVVPGNPQPVEGAKEQTVCKEAKLEAVNGQQGKGTAGLPKLGFQEEVTEVPEATSERPVTMIFMGYHNVDDDEETKKLLGFDGTIKAEIVLIDEDDEKSLREKTVTDISTMDGNAADLVSGRPLSDTTELSSECKDESSAKEITPPDDSGVLRSAPMAGNCGALACVQTRTLPTALKHATKLTEDDSELKRERALKSVSFLDSVSVIPAGNMDLESPFSEAKADSQQNYHPTSGQNGVKNRHESLDNDVAKEIRYLDEVLEANCCDPGTDAPSNGSTFPEHKAINIDGTGPSVLISGMRTPRNDEVIVEGKMQTTFIENLDPLDGKHNGHSVIIDQQLMRPSEEPSAPTTKREARFELRAFQEEKRPSKLFEDSAVEKEPVRVKKVLRPSEETAELERERQELIRGQAVKKNPGMAAKWNPPQEKTLEQELDPEQLESLRKYEERKQRRPETSSVPQVHSVVPTMPVHSVVPTMPTEPGRKEDIVVEQIDFSAARKQFQQREPSKQPIGPKRGVTPQLYSAKPFSRTTEVTHVERPSSSVMMANHCHGAGESLPEVTSVKAERIYYDSGDMVQQEAMTANEMKEDRKVCPGDSDFTCARAVMTILKEEDHDTFSPQRSANSSCLLEEIDSGLDDLSIRSQDTTVLETLSNDFSMDNVSDSGASNEPTNAMLENSLGDFSFPTTPQATTPVNGKLGGGPGSPSDLSMPLSKTGPSLMEQQLEYHAGILVQNAIQQAIAEQTNDWRTPPQVPERITPVPEQKAKNTEHQPPPSEERAKFEPSQASSPVQAVHSVAPKIAARNPSDFVEPPTRSKTQSPPPSEKQEFSYFSKYSEAAELRSTASMGRPQEMEVSSGPFRLRSRKQRTLSMIEEEIRAAQEREEELKKQRQTQALQAAASYKQKTSSLPPRLSLSGRTAPGKIEKIRPGPLTPVSPASEGPLPSPGSDAGSSDSGGSQRPKNFMQTLMEDYETHKVKRREKMEDNSVLEATRVTRRKSNMALRWEAGIYANQEEAEEEE
ncbi:hypothetical protein GJAV_G00037930 [Gymnothorax javanicus]|nr:hypothetical protein GJAV_G00037930 [Gymnothorax javanicus]